MHSTCLAWSQLLGTRTVLWRWKAHPFSLGVNGWTSPLWPWLDQALACSCILGPSPQAQMRKHSTDIQKDLQRGWPRERCFLENYLTISNYIIIHSQVQCCYHFQSILQFLKSFHIITDWLILRLMFSSLERDAGAQRGHIRCSCVCQPDATKHCEQISFCWWWRFLQWFTCHL